MAFPQVWGIALALKIPSLQVVLHEKKGKKKKRILRLVSLSLFLVTLMFCFYLDDSEFLSVAMHAHKACCCRTRSVSLKAEGVKPLLNGPIHANKEPWKWSSQQTPGYYLSI